MAYKWLTEYEWPCCFDGLKEKESLFWITFLEELSLNFRQIRKDVTASYFSTLL